MTAEFFTTTERRFHGPHPWPLVLVLSVILLFVGARGADAAPAQDTPDSTSSFWGHATSPADTLGAFNGSLWGPIPARNDSVSTSLTNNPRPTWETAVMVPYWVVGVPFWLVYQGLHQTVIGMDKLGLFGEAAAHPGIRIPTDTYLMPVISIGDLEGFTLGLQAKHYDFLGPGNMLFLQASRSTRKADEISGGTLFQMGRKWSIQVGGGTEEKNLTRYFGLGPNTDFEDLSYYHRRVTWGGFELDKVVGRKVGLKLRTYSSKVEALEPVYEIDQSIGRVHGDDLPFGYPGTSTGWTWRLALYRDNADQRGRPRQGGFQSLGVSLFNASDGSGLQYLTYHANLEKFFSLWHTDRTLAVRGFFNRISNVGNADIPFTRMVTFQRPDDLRGYHSLRFYGMGSLGLSTEYRWPVWVARGRNDMGVDAYIFSDIGQVFEKSAEISLDNIKITGGAGLRLVDSHRGFAARFEIGFSDEQTIVRLKFSQTFQYDPKGMLYGKNPTKVY